MAARIRSTASWSVSAPWRNEPGVRPRTSSRRYPVVSSKAGLTQSIRPTASVMTTRLLVELATIESLLSSSWYSCSRVTSRSTATTPPFGMGEVVSTTRTVRPSACSSRVASSWCSPVRSVSTVWTSCSAVLGEEGVDGPAEAVAGRPSGQRLPGGVQEDQRPVRGRLDDGVGEQLEASPHAVLRLDQRLHQPTGGLDMEIGGEELVGHVCLGHRSSVPSAHARQTDALAISSSSSVLVAARP